MLLIFVPMYTCRCIRGLLLKSQVILVTHQVQFAVRADQILVLSSQVKGFHRVVFMNVMTITYVCMYVCACCTNEYFIQYLLYDDISLSKVSE